MLRVSSSDYTQVGKRASILSFLTRPHCTDRKMSTNSHADCRLSAVDVSLSLAAAASRPTVIGRSTVVRTPQDSTHHRQFADIHFSLQLIF